MPKRSVSLWDRGGLRIGASLSDSGELVIAGHHLRGRSEYEYSLTVAVGEVPVVVEALGGAPGSDVLTLLSENADAIVQQGEASWLGGLGIKPGFWSHGDWFDVIDAD